MALPNPQSKLIDNSGKQVVTLGQLLQVQTDVEKWSQNTDINTFRAQVESEKGFNQLRVGLTGVQEAIKENRELGESIDAPVKESLGALDAVARTFRAAIKPFAGLTKNLSDVKFGEIGPSFFSVTRASERMNSGFKELTNGIGELGPMFNNLRTQIFKAVSVFNIFLGIIQFIGAGIMNVYRALFKPALNERKSDTQLNKEAKTAAEERLKEGKAEDSKVFGETDSKLNKLRDAATNIAMDDMKVTFIDGTASYFENMRRAFGLALTDINLRGEASAGAGDTFGEQKQKAENKFNEERTKNEKETKKLERKRNRLILKERKADEKKFFNFRMKQELKFLGMRVVKTLLPLLALLGGALGVFLIFKNKINDFADMPLSGIFAGFKTGLTKAVDDLKRIFGSLRTALSKIPGIGKFFKPKPPPKVTPPKPGGAAAKEATKTALKEGGDDVAKQAAAASGKEMAKTVGKQLVKKIPIIGAGAEIALDASANESKFNKIKTAYENEIPIMPDGEGGLRPMTAEEFAAAEASMMANRAGSAGRGGGALAGATAGAATGAAIGSVIPVVGTAIGGIIGGVLGGFFGGRAGDKVATDLANKAEGIDDPQAYIDMLAQNVPELQNEAGAELASANGEVADATAAAGAGGSMNNQQFSQTDNSTSNQFNGSEIPVSDQQADYSYA